MLLRQVGAVIDVGQVHISKFERGVRKPTPEAVKQFAKCYGLKRKMNGTSLNIAQQIEKLRGLILK